jgi:hypothetical protein
MIKSAPAVPSFLCPGGCKEDSWVIEDECVNGIGLIALQHSALAPAYQLSIEESSDDFLKTFRWLTPFSQLS